MSENDDIKQHQQTEPNIQNTESEDPSVPLQVDPFAAPDPHHRFPSSTSSSSYSMNGLTHWQKHASSFHSQRSSIIPPTFNPAFRRPTHPLDRSGHIGLEQTYATLFMELELLQDLAGTPQQHYYHQKQQQQKQQQQKHESGSRRGAGGLQETGDLEKDFDARFLSRRQSSCRSWNGTSSARQSLFAHYHHHLLHLHPYEVSYTDTADTDADDGPTSSKNLRITTSEHFKACLKTRRPSSVDGSAGAAHALKAAANSSKSSVIYLERMQYGERVRSVLPSIQHPQMETTKKSGFAKYLAAWM
jgi:hypothetical protein